MIHGQGLDDPPRGFPSSQTFEIETWTLEEDLLGDAAVQAVVGVRFAGAFAAAVATEKVDATREAFSVPD